MIYPEFPKAGDCIGICAPSAGVGQKEESFDLSMEVLRESGFELCETRSVRNDDCPSASAKARGQELNELFADDDVAAVMSAAGGDYNNEMLPYIDTELLRTHPKWFVGYSDPTFIEILLTTKLDIASIYGVNAGAWDWRPLHLFQENALRIISGDLIKQTSYDTCCLDGFSEDGYEFDTEVEWRLIHPISASESGMLDVRGRIIGGCTEIIDLSIGTDYEDLKGFAKRYASDGLIWLFDTFAMDPLMLFNSMQRMKLMGLFDNAKAVVFGRVFLPGDAADEDYINQVLRVFDGLDVPVVWGADIGHTKPSMTFINGAMGHLTLEGGKAELEMELR